MSKITDKLYEELHEKEHDLEELGNRCYELEKENHELLKHKKISKRNCYLLIILAMLTAVNLFIAGRLYQIKKDTIVVNEIQEQFDTLYTKYKDVCENSIYLK